MRNSECLFRIRWWFFVHQLNLFVFIMFSSEFFSPKIVISDQNRSRIAFQKKKNSEMKIRYFFCFICFGSMWVIFYLEFSSQFPLMILFLFRWMQNDMYPSKYLFVYVVYYLSMLAHIHLFKHTAFYRSLTRSIHFIIWFRFFFFKLLSVDLFTLGELLRLLCDSLHFLLFTLIWFIAFKSDDSGPGELHGFFFLSVCDLIFVFITQCVH